MQGMRLKMLYALSPMVCLALLAGTATVLRTHEQASVAPATSPAPPAEAVRVNRAGVDALGTGDRLRITFHETIDIAGGAPGGRDDADSVLRSFYQRTDLSGDYTIDEEGVVSLPRLGRFQATGLSLRD